METKGSAASEEVETDTDEDSAQVEETETEVVPEVVEPDVDEHVDLGNGDADVSVEPVEVS